MLPRECRTTRNTPFFRFQQEQLWVGQCYSPVAGWGKHRWWRGCSWRQRRWLAMQSLSNLTPGRPHAIVWSNSTAMEDAFGSSLSRLGALAAALCGSPDSHEQLEQLRSATAAVLAASKGQPPGPAHQKRLWEAAGGLWVSDFDSHTDSAVLCVHMTHLLPGVLLDGLTCRTPASIWQPVAAVTAVARVMARHWRQSCAPWHRCGRPHASCAHPWVLAACCLPTRCTWCASTSRQVLQLLHA